jgi:ubiquinone/menaquinone biosynthesis C-methylase UbiE
METLGCDHCGFRMEVDHTIVRALLPQRVDYYARFIREYEAIRVAEGRYSVREEYYLSLPYEDVSGKNREQWRIRAKSFDCLMERVLPEVSFGAKVLDIGAGNCWMSFRLALSGYRPFAVDLLTNDKDGLAAAVHYDNHLSHPIPRFQAEMTYLPFQEEQFDAIIFNASFHYSENYELTLREALRCLKRGGRVVIIDTPWYSNEESGRQMVAQRQASFRNRYGTASDSLPSLEFLTDERLFKLERELSIRWQSYSPRYGLKWAMRPIVASLRGRREPSRFRIYVATKDA